MKAGRPGGGAGAIDGADTIVGGSAGAGLWTLLSWGNRHFAPEGASVQIIDAHSGEVAEPVLVDRRSGKLLTSPQFRAAPGPAATARTRARYHNRDLS